MCTLKTVVSHAFACIMPRNIIKLKKSTLYKCETSKREVQSMKKLLSLALSLVVLLATMPLLTIEASAASCNGFNYNILNYVEVSPGQYVYYAKITGIDEEIVNGDVVIPERLDGKLVTSIDGSAFRDCEQITSVTIPDSVTVMGYQVFKGCTNLKSVTLPNNIAELQYSLFEGCTSLTSVTIPDSVTTMGDFVFRGCTALSNITIPNGVTTMGEKEFSGCTSLASVNIGDGLTSIPNRTFYGCTALSSVTLGKSINNIAEYAFYGCTSLASLTIPNVVTTIGNSAFYGCTGLTSITIPDSVTTIGTSAFNSCRSLQAVTIPDSVTTMVSGAFSNCVELKEITIPSSVTTIEAIVFSGCSGLTDVYFGGTEQQWNAINLYYGNDCLTGANIHYMAQKVNIAETTISGIYSKTYTGSYLTQSITVMDGTKKLVLNQDYKVSYSNNKNVGTAKVTITGIGDYTGSKTVDFTIKRPSIKSAALSTTTYTYNGYVKSPSVTVKDVNGRTLKSGTDYTLTRPSGRKNVGKYTYKISFKGNYAGLYTKTLTMKIIPKGATIRTPASGTGYVTAKWYKQSSKMSNNRIYGYQIAYSTKSSFSGAKYKYANGYSKASYKISKLKKKTYYYVKVRTRMKVNGTWYYSNWSKVKKIRTK